MGKHVALRALTLLALVSSVACSVIATDADCVSKGGSVVTVQFAGGVTKDDDATVDAADIAAVIALAAGASSDPSALYYGVTTAATAETISCQAPGVSGIAGFSNDGLFLCTMTLLPRFVCDDVDLEPVPAVRLNYNSCPVACSVSGPATASVGFNGGTYTDDTEPVLDAASIAEVIDALNYGCSGDYNFVANDFDMTVLDAAFIRSNCISGDSGVTFVCSDLPLNGVVCQENSLVSSLLATNSTFNCAGVAGLVTGVFTSSAYSSAAQAVSHRDIDFIYNFYTAADGGVAPNCFQTL